MARHLTNHVISCPWTCNNLVNKKIPIVQVILGGVLRTDQWPSLLEKLKEILFSIFEVELNAAQRKGKPATGTWTFHFTDQYTTTRPPATLNSGTCSTTVDITTNFGNCVIS